MPDPSVSMRFEEPLSLFGQASDLAAARLDERLLRETTRSSGFKRLPRDVQRAVLAAWTVAYEAYRSHLAVAAPEIRALANHLDRQGLIRPSQFALTVLDALTAELSVPLPPGRSPLPRESPDPS